eukprot:7772040-Pyramimonas_sp.AAC.1
MANESSCGANSSNMTNRSAGPPDVAGPTDNTGDGDGYDEHGDDEFRGVFILGHRFVASFFVV